MSITQFDLLNCAVVELSRMFVEILVTLKSATVITNIVELSYLYFVNIKVALPNISIFKLCMLKQIVKYLQEKKSQESSTTIAVIRKFRKGHQKPLVVMLLPTTISSVMISLTMTSIKTSLNYLPAVSDDPIKFELWNIEATPTPGQTPHGFLVKYE